MKRPERAALARLLLDERFAEHGAVVVPVRPQRGWIRAIRDALDMSSRQLGERLGVAHSSVVQLERSEVSGTIKLVTLARVAEALDCDLVYSLVPRRSLEETVRSQARSIALVEIGRVDRTMSLEDQRLPSKQLQTQLEAYAHELISEGRLWDHGPA